MRLHQRTSQPLWGSWKQRMLGVIYFGPFMFLNQTFLKNNAVPAYVLFLYFTSVMMSLSFTFKF